MSHQRNLNPDLTDVRPSPGRLGPQWARSLEDHEDWCLTQLRAESKEGVSFLRGLILSWRGLQLCSSVSANASPGSTLCRDVCLLPGRLSAVIPAPLYWPYPACPDPSQDASFNQWVGSSHQVRSHSPDCQAVHPQRVGQGEMKRLAHTSWAPTLCWAGPGRPLCTCYLTFLSLAGSLTRQLLYIHFTAEKVETQPGSVKTQAQAGSFGPRSPSSPPSFCTCSDCHPSPPPAFSMRSWLVCTDSNLPDSWALLHSCTHPGLPAAHVLPSSPAWGEVHPLSLTATLTAS